MQNIVKNFIFFYICTCKCSISTICWCESILSMPITEINVFLMRE